MKPEEPPLDLALDTFLATLKTASVLESWVSEEPIVEITRRFGIGAGDLRSKVEDADWLLFAAGRLASVFQRRVGRAIDDLSFRIRYGVREELLDLVRLRGIGRVRARLLYRAGYPDRESLRNAPIDRIEQALRSRRLAEMVASQLTVRPEGVRAPPAGTPSSPRPGERGERRARSTVRRLDDFPADEPS